VKVGLTLPTFTADGAAPVRAAREAEAAGLDGVFVFDHLWPIGSPGRPALSAVPVLGAVAQATSTVTVGPLVARVGLVDDDRLVDWTVTAATIAGPARFVAALGVGDHLSAAENLAYGVAYPSAGDRLVALAAVLDRLSASGLTTWGGGRSAALRRVVAGHADALNIWGASTQELAAESADVRARAGERPVEITWGGQVLIGVDEPEAAALLTHYGERPNLVHGTVAAVAGQLQALAAGGATWAVCAPLDLSADQHRAVEKLAEVARLVH
jgi:alkanesulfonate monooxygenase SsuD/methylene tetrahydromethanopterin reductase-like flavin-dependent oxidoreductase (luciferase family)